MAQADMLEDGVISLEALGTIMTAHGLLYGASRFINGFWADRVNACVFCMLFAALFSFAFWSLPTGAPGWQATLILMGAGFCIYGPQALAGIITANQATKEAAALATGFRASAAISRQPFPASGSRSCRSISAGAWRSPRSPRWLSWAWFFSHSPGAPRWMVTNDRSRALNAAKRGCATDEKFHDGKWHLQ